jgi:hypothetical protein
MSEQRERHPGEGWEDGGRPHKRLYDSVHYGHRRADDTLTEPREAEPVLPLENLYGPCECGAMVRDSEIGSTHRGIGYPGHRLSMAVAADRVPIRNRRRRDRRSTPTQPVPNGLDVERLARAMARIAEVGPPAHLNPDDAEEHWRSYLAEASDYAAEYLRLAACTPPAADSSLDAQVLCDAFNRVRGEREFMYADEAARIFGAYARLSTSPSEPRK